MISPSVAPCSELYRVRQDVVPGRFEHAERHHVQRRNTRCRRVHDPAPQPVHEPEHNRGADDAVGVEDGEGRAEQPIETGVQPGRERPVDVADVRVEVLAAQEPERLIHLAADIHDRIRPALPRRQEQQHERGGKDDEPRHIPTGRVAETAPNGGDGLTGVLRGFGHSGWIIAYGGKVPGVPGFQGFQGFEGFEGFRGVRRERLRRGGTPKRKERGPATPPYDSNDLPLQARQGRATPASLR